LDYSSVNVTTDYYIHYFPKLDDENIRKHMFDGEGNNSENNNKNEEKIFAPG